MNYSVVSDDGSAEAALAADSKTLEYTPVLADAGKEVVITVKANDGNDDSDNVTITLSVAKVTPVVDGAVIAPEKIVKGKVLSTIPVPSGDFKVSGSVDTVVEGTFTWTNPDTTVNTTGNQNWTFTPNNRTAYEVVTGDVNVELKSDNAKVTSETYDVAETDATTGTIKNVPFGTSKADFKAALSKGQADQTWDDSSLTEPVATNDTLEVTAEDGATKVTYTVTVVDAETDVDLATVLDQTITAGDEVGASGTPKKATINVANTVDKVKAADIVASGEFADVKFYGTDSEFSSEESGEVSLTETSSGDLKVYIKVIAQDDTERYYEVEIVRADA